MAGCAGRVQKGTDGMTPRGSQLGSTVISFCILILYPSASMFSLEVMNDVVMSDLGVSGIRNSGWEECRISLEDCVGSDSGAFPRET